MSQRFSIQIILPIVGYEEDKIYNSEALSLQITNFNQKPDNVYYRHLRVKFLYATSENIVKFACQKYSLGKINDFTVTMDCLGTHKIIHEDRRYVITKEEKQLATEHIKEAIYCNEFKECCMSWFYSSNGDELLPEGMAIIDDELMQKASDIAGCSSEKDFANRMADVIDKVADDEDYFIANFILAKEVASHMNGRAILWYGD